MRTFKYLTRFLIFSFLLLPLKSPVTAASQETSWQAIGQVGGMIGATRPLAGQVEGIAVSQDLAFIVNSGGSTQVVDIADPAHLQATPTKAPSGIQICGISFGMVIAAGWIWARRHRT